MVPLLEAGVRSAVDAADAAGAVLAGSLLAGVMFFMFFLIAIALLCTAFWIWMLVDCAMRKNFRGENDKVIWILVIVFLHWLGGLVYYFAVKRSLDKRHRRKR